MSMDFTFHRISALSPRWLIMLACVICGLLLLHQVYSTMSVLWENTSLPLERDAGLHSVSTDHEHMLKEIIGAHLFKEAAKSDDIRPVAAGLSAESYELRGTFTGLGEAQSYAIILQSGQPEKGYRIGDLLSGNTKVDTIYTDHVSISDGTTKQDIYLKKPQ